MCLLAYVALAVWIGLADGPPAIDGATARWMHANRIDSLATTWRAIALVGGSITLGVVMLAGCVVAWRRAGGRWLTFLVMSYAGVELLFWSTKAWVDRPRPPVSLHLATVGSPSFPSGHTAVATAVGASLLVAASRTRRLRLRRAAVVGLVALPVVVGTSRLALGVHWLTDVVGGALLGLGWVLALAALLIPARDAGADSPGRPSPPPNYATRGGLPQARGRAA